MKALKIIGIIVLVVFIGFFAVGFILPSEVNVTRSKVIDAPKEVVFNEVNTLKNWEDWSPWHHIDPNMGLNYEGPEHGRGAIYSWTSKHPDVGNGRLEVTESEPYGSISTHMIFDEEYHSDITYLFEEAGEGTRCTWTMHSDMGNNIIGRWMGLFMDQMIGKDFEKGLQNLELSAKRRKADLPQKTKPSIVSLEPRKVVTVRRDCPSSDISSTLGECYAELLTHMEREGVRASAPPFSIYHSYSETTTSLEAGLEVDRLPASTEVIEARELPATRAVMLSYFGPYEGTVQAHAMVDRYIEENKLAVTGAPWEVYVTDPDEEPDQAKWLTEIYYPLASN